MFANLTTLSTSPTLKITSNEDVMIPVLSTVLADNESTIKGDVVGVIFYFSKFLPNKTWKCTLPLQ